LLFPLLRRNRLLFGISLADTRGDSYYLTGRDDGFLTRVIRDTGTGRKAVRRLWDANQKLLSEEEQPSTYDPRSRPWFAPALSAEGICWTKPYAFFERRVVGITASIARKVHGGPIVVALDVLLDDLFREIQYMAPSPNSRVFIFRNDARIYMPGQAGSPSDFRAMVDVGDPLIQKVLASWEERLPPNGRAFEVRHDRQTWWCGFRSMEDANRHVWVGVMVPEVGIMGSVGRRWTGLWALGGVVLLLAGGLIFFMIRRYGRSVDTPEHGFDSRDPEKSIQELIAKGEGRTVEFSKYLCLHLATVDGGQAGVVACRRSAEPVHLKAPKSEEFYIPSGPSSEALPVSKVVAYIRTRKYRSSPDHLMMKSPHEMPNGPTPRQPAPFRPCSESIRGPAPPPPIPARWWVPCRRPNAGYCPHAGPISRPPSGRPRG
jgi:hypothetical protein